jgi:hypothetical protein
LKCIERDLSAASSREDKNGHMIAWVAKRVAILNARW